MKFAVALIVLAVSAVPVSAGVPMTAAKTDWSKTVVAVPSGFRIGNPNAPVKLVEYGSYTCSHCRDFHLAAKTDLRAKYLAGGRVSFEFRSFVRNGPDYAATLLAGCGTPAAFAARSDVLFATQSEWTQGYATLSPEAAAKVEALPEDRKIAGLADAGGLTRFMTARGLAPTAAARCLADKAAAERLTATLKRAVEVDKVGGTPGFLINGKLQTGPERPITTWADLEPRLVEALR